jgi:two-component system chemotaxis response regulator CheB
MKRVSSNYQLTGEERDFVFSLIEKVTGTCQRGDYRREVLAANVERRIRYIGAKSLKAYLAYATRDPMESELLVSALTIHTTSWFREFPHFEKLEESVRRRMSELKFASMHILCAGCSTGEEAYSIAFMLEKLRREIPGFDYRVHGVDIDPISVTHASRGVYGSVAFSLVPDEYKKFCDVGQGRKSGFFAPNKEIRKRCSFEVDDLRTISQGRRDSFDFIFCRNVLIYFNSADIPSLVSGLLSTLKLDGELFLGHSEGVDAGKYGLRFIGDSTYVKRRTFTDSGRAQDPACRVLVVDDSATARKAIERSLEKGGLAAFSVASAEEASEFLEKHSVDVITLDVSMPGLDGPTWLNSRRLAGLGIPVVIVSETGASQALSILSALENGAQDYIEKSAVSGGDFADRVAAIANSYRPRSYGSRPAQPASATRGVVRRDRPDVILIGASTGGTEAVMCLLDSMPSNCPPILLVQHISAYFAHAFAQRVAQNSKLPLGVCADGAPLEAGHVYVADDDRHLGIRGKRGRLAILRSDGPPVNRHRPSVDFLFKSAAVIADLKVSAVLLTGMGADGAEGMRELYDKGAVTFAQNEQSCVVFGMPREAIALGAVNVTGTPAEIRQQLQWQMSSLSEGDGREVSKMARLAAGKVSQLSL